MTDDIWKRAEIESPCIKICVIEPKSRLCTGCLRSIDEIGGWSGLTPQARQDIMSQLDSRRSQLSKRKGGRAARLRET